MIKSAASSVWGNLRSGKWTIRILLVILLSTFALGYFALDKSDTAKAEIQQAQRQDLTVMAQGTNNPNAPFCESLDATEDEINKAMSQGACRPAPNPEANSETQASPAAWAEYAKSKSTLISSQEYLTFDRWFGLNIAPVTEVSMSSLAQIPSIMSSFIGAIFFVLASVIFIALGTLLSAAMSIDLLSRVIYSVDWLFGSVGTTLLGLDNPSSTLMVIMGFIFVSVAAAILIPRSRFKSGSSPLGQIGFSLTVIAAIAVMTTQATKNHEGEDTMPAIGQTEDGYSIGTSGDENEEGAQWAALSPGWLIHKASIIANTVAGGVVSVTESITSSVSAGNVQGNGSDCERYINGMHQVYSNTQAAKDSGGRSKVLVAYDNMVTKLYFANYKTASWGTSEGSENSWCRIAEATTDQSVGDQIMISRVAGLYQEMIGTGGLGMVNDDPGQVADIHSMNISGRGGGIDVGVQEPAPGGFINAAGEWNPRGEENPTTLETRQAAEKIFGPNYAVISDHEKSTAPRGGNFAAIYFAACNWPQPGGPVALNPEYENVYQGSNSGFTNPSTSEDAENVDKQKLNAKKCRGAGEEGIWIHGFGVDTDAANFWNYYDKQSGEISIPVLSTATGYSFTWGEESAATQFLESAPAMDMYRHVYGGQSLTTAILAVIAFILSLAVLRYFGPMVLGAVMSQAVAALALIISPLSAVFLIFPTGKSKRIFATVGQTILSALLVASLLTTLMSFIFAMVGIFIAVLQGLTNVSVVNSLLVGAGALIGFAASMKIIESITGQKANSVGSSFQMGAMAASPVLNNAGYNVPSPLTKDFWKGEGPVRSKPRNDLSTDKDTKSGIQKRLEGINKDSKNLINKGGKKLLSPDGKVQKGLDAAKKYEDGSKVDKVAAFAGAIYGSSKKERMDEKRKKALGQAESGYSPDIENKEAMEKSGITDTTMKPDKNSKAAKNMGVVASDQYLGENPEKKRSEAQNSVSDEVKKDLQKTGGSPADVVTDYRSDQSAGQSSVPSPSSQEDIGQSELQSPVSDYPITNAPTERTEAMSQRLSAQDTSVAAATVISAADLMPESKFDLGSVNLGDLQTAINGKLDALTNDYVEAYSRQMTDQIKSARVTTDTPKVNVDISDKIQGGMNNINTQVGDTISNATTQNADRMMNNVSNTVNRDVRAASEKIGADSARSSNEVINSISRSIRNESSRVSQAMSEGRREMGENIERNIERSYSSKYNEIINKYNDLSRGK